MVIRDIIDEVSDLRYQKRARPTTAIYVHRTGRDLARGLDIGTDAWTICDAFRGKIAKWSEVAAATNKQVPYTFIIGGESVHDGKVWQCLPLDEIGWHARAASETSIGIACIGDFRYQDPTDKQYYALYKLCQRLIRGLNIHPGMILGHGEDESTHDGTKSPGRHNACPGHLLDVPRLRKQLLAGYEADRDEALSGIIRQR